MSEMEIEATSNELSFNDALRVVLKTSLLYDGLRRGLHESAKALDRGAARLCILAEDCDNAEYTTLIRALCKESNVPLVLSPTGLDIGEWVGLVKLHSDGSIRKSVRCSVAVVTDFGEDSPALAQVLDFISKNN